jgi:uncharacterized membrane protein YeaQ/YmgE (transglycosylase-associated protein family)
LWKKHGGREARWLSGRTVPFSKYQPINCPNISEETTMFSPIYFLLIGLAAAWLVGKFLKGRSFGLRNLMIGFIVAILGEFLYRLFGLLVGGIGVLMLATVWATVLLMIVQKAMGNELKE